MTSWHNTRREEVPEERREYFRFLFGNATTFEVKGFRGTNKAGQRGKGHV